MTEKTVQNYSTLPGKQAFQMYGESYADYVEEHELDLLARGYAMPGRSLGETLDTGQSYTEILPYELP